jgi:hypothetical protein
MTFGHTKRKSSGVCMNRHMRKHHLDLVKARLPWSPEPQRPRDRYPALHPATFRRALEVALRRA